MTKILVTGGAGFIGSNLVDSLVLQGYQVVVVDNLVTGRRNYLNPAAKFYKMDIRSRKMSDIFATEKPDFVYHLAAQIEVSKSVLDPLFDNKVNVIGSLNILENCLKYKVKRIIFASTGGAIYGEAEQIPTPESTTAYPVSPYGIHKLAFEKYLKYYHHIFDQDYTILRFSNVYGPRQYRGGEAGVIAIFVANAVLGRTSFVYGDGFQTRDFIFIEDVVKALLAAKNLDYQGRVNIGSGQEINLWQIVKAIEKVMGEKMLVEKRPAKPGEQRRSCLSFEHASKVLNWLPETNLEEGIRKTIAWARENKANL